MIAPTWKRLWRPLLIPIVLLTGLGLIWYKAHVLHQLLPSAAMKKRLVALCQRTGVEYPLKAARLAVHKNAHQMELYEGNKIVKIYHVALGKNSQGPKTEKNDGKTPEGDYYICEKIPEATHHLYLGFSYPNSSDVEQGFKNGWLLATERAELLQQNQFKRRPNSRSKLGGNCGLHGGGAKTDWTDGNLALEDADMEEIFYLVPLKAPIRITP